MPANSIRKLLTISNVAILLIMLLPALVSVLLMRNYAAEYHSVITQVRQASELRPIVMEKIPDELFAIVAGRTTFETGKVQGYIEEINRELDQLSARQSVGSVELVVARRTMNTLKDYTDRMQALTAQRAPVADSEALLEEVRAVAALVGDILQDYTAQEIAWASEYSGELQGMVSMLTMGSLGLIAAAGLLSYLSHRRLSRAIHEPLRNLVHFAEDVAQGRFAARVPNTTTEELVSLSESLNLMAGKLQELIDQNQREQENLKRSELRTLQAQITPHFLYNTLDAIVWLAEEEKSEEVILITKALSDFFRTSLNQGRDFITMEEERKHLKGYLTIEKIRYRDVLDYEIDIPEAVYGYELPKLLIQPLVENAIYHGVKNRRGGGKVTVRVAEAADTLRVSVRDTGPGIDEDTLRGIRAALDAAGEAPLPGYGLANVHRRIRLYHRLSEGLVLTSDATGTLVSFDLPKHRT
ncbi:MAG: sensor histidine kinase [Oscillospiraceae bacterium]|jgi:two-component system sensor histidine kinase YesM|nr:sensor histidine kinase [Oscillospiraceae bacterium]